VGDAGGYMGLLLGSSLLSIYDDIMELIQFFLKKKVTPTK
jgi:hypothetical protein